MATSAKTLDTQELESRVKEMYREVAEHPEREFHFETGRALAERLGYPSSELDEIPAEAIDSFAGVGYYFDLADVRPGETAVDLGSGAGMDSFLAARKVGGGGRVIGIDMTDAQLEKATSLAGRAGFAQVEFRKAYIEALPVEDASVDVVISNGVINLSPDKATALQRSRASPTPRRQARDRRHRQLDPTARGRHLRRLALGRLYRRRDATRRLPADDRRRRLHPRDLRENEHYRFVSDRADNATQKYGVKSISLLALKTT